MDKNNKKNVFNKYLQPIDEGILIKMAEQMGLDKYVKKLKIIPFVKLFTYAQLKQISSLTDITRVVFHDDVTYLDDLVLTPAIPADVT